MTFSPVLTWAEGKQMQKDKVTEVLRSLATGDKNRSETARLRDVFDDVENALQAGVVRTAILEALNAQGFTMTLKSFESALYRIRKERAKNQLSVTNQTPQTISTSVAAVTSPEPGADNKPPNIDDLGDLDKKQRRELRADQFIKPENTNPLLKRIKDQKK